MAYANPRPKRDRVKAGVWVRPETLTLVDRLCGVLGRSRNSWLEGLIQRNLVPLAKEADAWMDKCKGGQNGPVGKAAGFNKVVACLTKSRPQRKASKSRR